MRCGPQATPLDLKYREQRETCHLQRLDVLKLVSVPLFNLLVLPCCVEEMSLRDELEEHDAVESKQGEGRKGKSAESKDNMQNKSRA